MGHANGRRLYTLFTATEGPFVAGGTHYAGHAAVAVYARQPRRPPRLTQGVMTRGGTLDRHRAGRAGRGGEGVVSDGVPAVRRSSALGHRAVPPGSGDGDGVRAGLREREDAALLHRPYPVGEHGGRHAAGFTIGKPFALL
jgi:hypothetical protein